MLDLSTLTIEDVTCRLWAVDECMEQATTTMDNGKLLLTEEVWAARKKSKETFSSCGGDGKHRGKASSKKKKKVDPSACRRCGKTSHWAKECPNRKQEKKAKAHLAQADEDDEATPDGDVEAKEKGEVMAVEGHNKALKVVNLVEPHAQVHL
jgi:hypothetical protein